MYPFGLLTLPYVSPVPHHFLTSYHHHRQSPICLHHSHLPDRLSAAAGDMSRAPCLENGDVRVPQGTRMVVGNATIPLHPTELVVGPEVNVVVRGHVRTTVGACTPNFHTSPTALAALYVQNTGRTLPSRPRPRHARTNVHDTTLSIPKTAFCNDGQLTTRNDCSPVPKTTTPNYVPPITAYWKKTRSCVQSSRPWDCHPISPRLVGPAAPRLWTPHQRKRPLPGGGRGDCKHLLNDN